jgi:MFS family permease
MSETPAPKLGRLTGTQWLICIIASIGFAFDTYELLMLPLIIKPAIESLSYAPQGDPLWSPGGEMFTYWSRLLFFVPAIAGGVFGMLGGYLTDRLGRRRVLTWSILIYAFAACASGFATTLPQLLFFRCLVFIGVCVEFVAAVAWLAEIFPEPKRREKVLGYTQAFSSLGGVMVALLNMFAANYAESLPAIHGHYDAWRYTMISGVIPAIPLILIRPFLPESPLWQKKRAEGTLKRASMLAVFSPELRKTTIITTIAFASTFGLAYGAIQQHSQIIAGHVQVKATVDKAIASEIAERKAASQPAPTPEDIRRIRLNTADEVTSSVQTHQEIGGLLGRVVLAVVILYIASKRSVLRLFQIPALIFVPLLFWWISNNLTTDGTLTMWKWGMFFAGFFVVAQMSFWGNYIPLVFPVHLRGTGESVAANIGGRVIGTAAAFLTLSLASSFSAPAPVFAAPTKPATVNATAAASAPAASMSAATSVASAPASSAPATTVATTKKAPAVPTNSWAIVQAKAANLALASAIIAGLYALIGMIVCFWLPHPPKEIEHEH